MKPMIEERKKAATTIQARIRGYFVRNKQKKSQKEQESALKIQRGTNCGIIKSDGNYFPWILLIILF